MRVSGIFGLHDVPLRIDREGIALSVERMAGGLLINPNPVEPVNKPKELTPHFLTGWYALRMEMPCRIKKTLEENGIEIAFPQRVVWFADELRKREVRDAESGSSGNSL